MSIDIPEELEVIWNALHGFREDCIPEGEEMYDDQWSEITTSMARITEALGFELNRDGDAVETSSEVEQ
ncbi:MAG: hypothetical protein CL942_15750 [Desulfovibrio sp.]|nr:hypothetical protein [Desulfovibrio sp.]|tara:strand:+ start:665 stop:871 length:207 start_codon:yes stop_codon:yes gene_type:complete